MAGCRATWRSWRRPFGKTTWWRSNASSAREERRRRAWRARAGKDSWFGVTPHSHRWTPFRARRGCPGDKSISHRADAWRSGRGGHRDRGVPPGADCLLALIACFRALGIQIEQPDRTRVIVHGAGEAGLQEPEDLLYAGNSGTTLYLTLGVLAGQAFTSVLTGDLDSAASGAARVDPTPAKWGPWILARRDGTLPPVTIRGGASNRSPTRASIGKRPGEVRRPPGRAVRRGVTTAISPAVPRPYRERMLRGFGADVRVEGDARLRARAGKAAARPTGLRSGRHLFGDFPPGGGLHRAGFRDPGRKRGDQPTRSGIVDALQAMGARITVEREREVAGEPVADLRVCASELRGHVSGRCDHPRLIDEIPILAVAAACATGDTVIRDAGALRIKETDRIATTAALLRAYGVAVEVLEDGMVVHGAGDPRA